MILKKDILKKKLVKMVFNALTNFVIASVILSDFENTNVDFDEIKNFYKSSPESFQNKRPINIAMTTIYSRLNDFRGMVFHLEKIIKSGDFISMIYVIMVIGDVLIKTGLKRFF